MSLLISLSAWIWLDSLVIGLYLMLCRYKVYIECHCHRNRRSVYRIFPRSNFVLPQGAEQKEVEQPQVVFQCLWPSHQTQRCVDFTPGSRKLLLTLQQFVSYLMSALNPLAPPSTNSGNVGFTLFPQKQISHPQCFLGFDKHKNVGGACGE